MYRVILVHLFDDQDFETRLNYAIEVTKKFNAFLKIVFVTKPAQQPDALGGRYASAAYIAESTRIAHKKSQEFEEKIQTKMKQQDIEWEMISEDGEHVDVLAKSSNYSDLVVIGQTDPSPVEERFIFHISDNLPFELGVPTVIHPFNQTVETISDKVMIAWAPQKETIRSVRQALPFLKLAKEVIILHIVEKDFPETCAKELQGYLERHEIKSKVVLEEKQSSEGKTIIHVAEKENIDLIVMGAYSKSRIKEMLFGGTTRYLMDHMNKPVFMCH